MKNPANLTPARPARSLELPRMATHFQNSVVVPGNCNERAGRAAHRASRMKTAAMNSSILPVHPLDQPGVLKLAPSETATAALESSGRISLSWDVRR